MKKLPCWFPRRAVLRTAAAVILSLLFRAIVGFLLLFSLMILFGYRGGYGGTLIALGISCVSTLALVAYLSWALYRSFRENSRQ
jgi:hypothetical protein